VLKPKKLNNSTRTALYNIIMNKQHWWKSSTESFQFCKWNAV